VGTRGAAAALAAGAAIGAAATIKPIAAAFLLPAALLPRRAGARHDPRGVLALGAGAAAAAGLVAAWLAARGGLGAFVDIVAGFVLPHYRSLGSVSLDESARDMFAAQAPL